MALREKFDGFDIRKILTGMITDKAVVARIASQWADGGLFMEPWANAVGAMAINHYKKFDEPPARLMPSIFEDWMKTTVYPEQEIQAVERFLVAMSDERHEEASEYIIDVAGRHFNRVAMERMATSMLDNLKHHDIDAAEAAVEKFRKVNLGVGSFGEPGRDIDIWRDAFSTEQQQPLFSYKGPLADFIGDAFQRGRLFAFMAPDKTGKTAWLIDAAYRALRAGRRVAFFDTGDGIEKTFLERIGCRAAGVPLRDSTIKIPIPDSENKATWGGDELKFHDVPFEGLDYVTAFRMFRDSCQSERALRTSFHGSSTLSANDIDGILTDWDRSGDYRPDLLVIDYADILAPPKGIKESIDQIDETWKTLHRIAQQRHCLVITATQASALAYGKEDGLLSKKHFSGRKTKLAHVDGMLGINVSNDEKDRGMARINWIVRRAAAYNEKHYCKVVGSMAIGNPAILSKRG